MSSLALNQIVARLAIEQHGVVTRRQLMSNGASEGGVTRLMEQGWLRPLYRGVYLVGAVAPPLAEELAACLACGPSAALSHRSAGILWRILPEQARPDRMEVSVRRGQRTRPGIRVYRSSSLGDDEITVRQGIPATTVPRTLLDLGRLLSPARMERAVAEAMALRLTDYSEMAKLIERHPRSRGVRRLRAVVGRDPKLTRSTAEKRFLRLVRAAGLDEPRTNFRVAGHEVDFFWPQRRLVVEVDGRAYHASPRSFDRDRRRDAELMGVGIRVMRVTWRQLTEEPEALLIRLGAVFARNHPSVSNGEAEGRVSGQ